MPFHTSGTAFCGEGGTLIIEDGGYRILDLNNKELAMLPGPSNQAPLLQTFLGSIKSGKRLNQDFEEGHKSTLLCYLGNIAYRTNSTLKCDPKTGRILGNKEASALWGMPSGAFLGAANTAGAGSRRSEARRRDELVF